MPENTLEQTIFASPIITGTVKKVINAFLIDRQSSKYSDNTVRFYSAELRYFINYLDELSITQINEITPDVIRSYILSLSSHRNPGGCHVAYRAIKVFLRWAWEELELEERNPMQRIKAPKVNRQPLPGISLENIQKLLEVCDGANAVRNRAMILFLFDSGVRASELCAIDIEDTDLLNGAVYVKHGKGNKRRTVYVGRNTLKEIRKYLKERKPAFKDNDPLFASQGGSRFTFNGLSTTIRRLCDDASIPRVGLHDFRRAFALNMLRNGADLVTLSRLMGHNSIEVLKGYLAITNVDLAAAHHRASPVNKLNQLGGI